MVKEFLDPSHDPFWKNADRALFYAVRDGRLVGRIAAIENRRHNEVHGDRVGFFGFFDCIDDPSVAGELFDAAEAWLAERDLSRIRGPMSPSMNHECGLLVDAYDQRPRILAPWHPDWYQALVHEAGFTVARSMVAYRFALDEGFEAPERLRRMVRRVRERERIELRPMDLKNIEAEADRILPLYNAAWDGNWGFVPMTREEFRFTAKSLKPLIRPELSQVATIDGEVVGFCVVVTDLNPVLAKIPSGRLGPVALARLALGVPRARHTRVMLLGLNPDRRRGSVLSILIEHASRTARELGHDSGDASWILEENHAMRSPLESLGLEPYRRWSVFEKEITPK